MNRFIKGFSYNFNKNLGKTDRAIRFISALLAILGWYLDFFPGIVGIVIVILAIMLSGTAVTGKCSIVYMLDANTMTKQEKQTLDKKGILYE